MSLARMTSGNFLENWKELSVEKQLTNDQFLDIYNQLANGACSFFYGDGSKEFAIQVAAANTFKRGSQLVN